MKPQAELLQSRSAPVDEIAPAIELLPAGMEDLSPDNELFIGQKTLMACESKRQVIVEELATAEADIEQAESILEQIEKDKEQNAEDQMLAASLAYAELPQQVIKIQLQIDRDQNPTVRCFKGKCDHDSQEQCITKLEENIAGLKGELLTLPRDWQDMNDKSYECEVVIKTTKQSVEELNSNLATIDFVSDSTKARIEHLEEIKDKLTKNAESQREFNNNIENMLAKNTTAQNQFRAEISDMLDDPNEPGKIKPLLLIERDKPSDSHGRNGIGMTDPTDTTLGGSAGEYEVAIDGSGYATNTWREDMVLHEADIPRLQEIIRADELRAPIRLKG